MWYIIQQDIRLDIWQSISDIWSDIGYKKIAGYLAILISGTSLEFTRTIYVFVKKNIANLNQFAKWHEIFLQYHKETF